MRRLLIAAIIAVASCAPPASESVSEGDVVTAAKVAVLAKLRDPQSAVFDGVHVSRGPSLPLVCGWVNSRNGFGGMTGRQRFTGSNNGATLEEEMAPGEMDKVWRTACGA